MNEERLRPKNYRFLIPDESPRAVSAQALADTIARADLQISAWLDGLAELIASENNHYWRGEIGTIAFQTSMAKALNEMHTVARLLRERPIQIRERG